MNSRNCQSNTSICISLHDFTSWFVVFQSACLVELPSSREQRHFLSALTQLKPLCFSSRQLEPSLSPRVPAHQCLSPTPPSAASWPAPVQLRTRAARKSVTGTSCTLKTLSPCKSSLTSLFSPFTLPGRDLGAARIGRCSHIYCLPLLAFVFTELITLLLLFHKDVS